MACYGVEDSAQFLVTVVYEIFFSLTICIRFMTSYVSEGSNKPVKDHAKIANRYLREKFFLDLIPWIPVVFFTDTSHEKFWRLFYLIKTVRMTYALNIVDVPYIMDKIKKY